MGLMYKQLAKQVLRNKVFVFLLLLLTTMTALSFFYVMFSIDGNMAALKELSSLSENQVLYQNALRSNTFLAYNFLASLTGLTAFVFVMFFYRFFRSNRKQVGCLKALGFKDAALRGFFVAFTGALSIAGAALGLVGGYFASGIQLGANMETYSVSGLVRALSPLSLVVGFCAATAVFCIAAFFCYGFVSGKEAGVLIAGGANTQNYSVTLRAADAVSRIAPAKNRFPLRIALRKPVAVLLMFVAVMSFSVCLIIGESLSISSQKVVDSQTTGHDYEYELQYGYVRFNAGVDEGALPYLMAPGTVAFGSTSLELNVFGFQGEGAVFALQDEEGLPVAFPGRGGVVVGPGLIETYGLRVAETVTITMDGNTVELVVLAVAANAKSDSVYLNAHQMTEALGLPPGSHNGDLRSTAPADLPEGIEVISREQRTDQLRRDAVSNNVSSVINKVTGVLVGCILIFLALFINFQDNTRDMLILHMMGYRIKAIRKMLINVYLPIVWTAFIVTLAPSIWLAQTIQRSLSISTNDYMPFGTSIWVVLQVFVLLNIVYLLIQAVFSLGIKRIIQNEDIAEYTTAE